jgi:hypothetical protein
VVCYERKINKIICDRKKVSSVSRRKRQVKPDAADTDAKIKQVWKLRTMTITAKYEDGVFKPLEDVVIEEGAIVEVHVRKKETAKPRSIRDLGFTGMWADRDDITDGVAYVNRLRDNPRG